MATILREGLTCDGYNVACLFGSTKMILHFPSTPTADEKTEQITAVEQRLLNEQVDELNIHDIEEEPNGILNW